MLAVAATGRAEDRKVTVYVQNTEIPGLVTLCVAKGVATRIFADIGVRIAWKAGVPPTTDRGVLVVTFDRFVPAAFHPGALAYARPFDRGAAIHLLYNRIEAAAPRQLVPSILAHVMAHEIGHVLRGDDGHATAGVMKAQFSVEDFHAMSVHRLSFTSTDAAMIRDYWTPPRIASIR
jgi:hypothetical protein